MGPSVNEQPKSCAKPGNLMIQQSSCLTSNSMIEDDGHDGHVTNTSISTDGAKKLIAEVEGK